MGWLITKTKEIKKLRERERERERVCVCSVPDACEFGPWKWKSQDL